MQKEEEKKQCSNYEKKIKQLQNAKRKTPPERLRKEEQERLANERYSIENEHLKLKNELISSEIDQIKQTTDFRKKWNKKCHRLLNRASYFLALFIPILGMKWLSYQDYPYFPGIVVGSVFAQIIGLGYIIVKHLFPIDPKRKN